MSTLEKRRCDSCGAQVVSDELFAAPAAAGWGKLYCGHGEYHDICPPCLVRIKDYLNNQRSTFMAEMSTERKQAE